jgi:ABC-type multidrug transport system permease subunit
MIMFSMMTVLTKASTVLVIQRQQGLLKRLAAAPMTRGEISGKWVARLGIGYVQVVVGLITGTVLFGVDWGPDLSMILIVLLAWSALCASLGLLLGNLVQTEAQGISVSALGALGLCALGGQWWPIEITPFWMHKDVQSAYRPSVSAESDV